jgi:hypothetical protein
MDDFDREYEEILEVIGIPSVSNRFDQAYLRSIAGRFPKNYLNFLEVAGAGTFLDGYFQICKPGDYKSIVKMIFEQDPLIDFKIVHLIGITAFGDMVLWEEEKSKITVRQWQHWVTQFFVGGEFTKEDEENIGSFQIAGAIYNMATNSEQYDENGDELFERCLAAYGPVKPGQIYAPRLAPAFGGTMNLEDFRIVSALETMAINVQMASFQLMDFSEFDKPRVIRQIGSM